MGFALTFDIEQNRGVRSALMATWGQPLTCDTCCTYWTGLGSEHRGYNIKSADLFRNGQSKPEVLKEGKEYKIPGEGYEEIWINCYMSMVDAIFRGLNT